MKKWLTMFFILAAPLVFADGKFVTYRSNGDQFEGYYVGKPGNAPLVLLVHDWDGLTDYEVRRSQMLSEMGYSVFAVDLFGKGNRPTTTEKKRALTGSLYKDRAKMRQLLNAGFAAAKEHGANADNAVAAGYCFGGAAVLEMARSGADLKGFVTFHGGLATPNDQDYKDTKGKVVVFHGTADQAVSMTDFAQLASQLEEQKIKHEMITYSGAPHAFTVFGSNRYREDADKKSWKRFGEFLNETLR